jgi:hypothetical protein
MSKFFSIHALWHYMRRLDILFIDIKPGAYRDTIVTRVMRADGKQQALDFNQKKFKDQVNKYPCSLALYAPP